MKQFIEDGRIKYLVLFASSYSFLISILYLYAFWGSFNINYLEHASIADVLKASIYPLLSIIVSFLIGYGIGEYNTIKDGETTPEVEKKYIQRFHDTRIILVIFASFDAFFNGFHRLWFSIPGLSVLWIVVATRKYFLKKGILKDYHSISVWTYIAILIWFPIMSFGVGKQNSHEILNDVGVRYVKTSQFEGVYGFEEQTKIKYIGLAGNYYFLLSLDNSKVYILNANSIKMLELSKPSSEGRESPKDSFLNWVKKVKKKTD